MGLHSKGRLQPWLQFHPSLIFESMAPTNPSEAQMGHYSKGRLQPWIHFHPSLTFEGKAGAHPCEAPLWDCTQRLGS
jgi:hypothetical protein